MAEVGPLKLELNEAFSVAVSQRNNQTFLVVFEENMPALMEISVTKGLLGIFGEAEEPLDTQQVFVQEQFVLTMPKLVLGMEHVWRENASDKE